MEASLLKNVVASLAKPPVAERTSGENRIQYTDVNKWAVLFTEFLLNHRLSIILEKCHDQS